MGLEGQAGGVGEALQVGQRGGEDEWVACGGGNGMESSLAAVLWACPWRSPALLFFFFFKKGMSTTIDSGPAPPAAGVVHLFEHLLPDLVLVSF